MARPRRRENQGMPSGMFARIQRSGNLYYYASLKCSNSKRRKEIPLGTDRLGALREFVNVMQAPGAHEYTYLDLCKRYEIEVIPKKAPATQLGNRQELKQLAKFFSDPPAPLSQISPQRVSEYIRWRKFSVRGNREKALLSHMFNFARSLGWTSLANPCSGIRGAAERGRDIYIEDEAFEIICLHASACTQNALALAYLTALRPSDTLSLTSSNLAPDKLVVKPSKTENSTRCKISIALHNDGGSLNKLGILIESLRPSDYRQGQPYALLRDSKGQQFTKAQLRRGFRNAKEKAIKQLVEQGNTALAAHISKIQIRDIRAKAATDKAMRTKDLLSVQKQLGHASITMTERYVRARSGDSVEPTK